MCFVQKLNFVCDFMYLHWFPSNSWSKSMPNVTMHYLAWKCLESDKLLSLVQCVCVCVGRGACVCACMCVGVGVHGWVHVCVSIFIFNNIHDQTNRVGNQRRYRYAITKAWRSLKLLFSLFWNLVNIPPQRRLSFIRMTQETFYCMMYR